MSRQRKFAKQDGEELVSAFQTLTMIDPNAPLQERMDGFIRIAGRFLDKRGLLDPKTRAYVRKLQN